MALPVVDDGDVGIVFYYVGDFHGIEGYAEELEVGREVAGKGQSGIGFAVIFPVIFLGVVAVIFLVIFLEFLAVIFDVVNGPAEGWVDEFIVNGEPGVLDEDGVINGDEALDVVDGVGMIGDVEFHGEALGVAVALSGREGIPLDVLDDFQLVDFEGLGLEVPAVLEDEDGWCAEGWGVGFFGIGDGPDFVGDG